VNGIIFLISFSANSLLADQKYTEFCVLILYTTTLLKVFIRAKCLLVESTESFKYRIISSANKDNLTYLVFEFLLFLSLALFL
jgi:hypothetical protein